MKETNGIIDNTVDVRMQVRASAKTKYIESSIGAVARVSLLPRCYAALFVLQDYSRGPAKTPEDEWLGCSIRTVRKGTSLDVGTMLPV